MELITNKPHILLNMDVVSLVDDFYKNFPFEKGIIGFSELINPIYYLKITATAFPVIIATGGIHAREYVTSSVLIETAEYLSKNLPFGTVYILPLINPDGAKITKTLPLYKSNARGVDLNVNFPAKWGTGKFNLKTVGSENYIGKFPLSERETQSLNCFTDKIKPDLTISFHTKGEEIYYDFNGNLSFGLKYAKVVQRATGYKIVTGLNSAGGYKDHCVIKGIPSLTVECGSDDLSHPIDLSHTKEIFTKIKDIIPLLMKELK